MTGPPGVSTEFSAPGTGTTRMDDASIGSGVQGVALTQFGLLLAVADLALFPDGGTLVVIGAAIIGLLGIIHSFHPLV